MDERPGARLLRGLQQAGKLALGALAEHRVLLLFVAVLGLKQLVGSIVLLGRILATPNMLLALIGEGLLLLVPVFALRGRRRVAGILCVDFVVSFVILTDFVYFRQFADLPSVAALRYVGLAAKVEGIVVALLRPGDFLYFLTGPLTLLLVRPRWVMAAPTFAPRRALVVAAAGLSVALLVALTSRAVRSPVGMRIRVANRLGPIGYHAYDVVTYATRSWRARQVDRGQVLDAAEALLSERARPSVPGRFGAARGMNVVVVQMESLQGFAAGHRVDGEPVTPSFDRLARESLVFERFFTQIGQGNTADAELLAQCSLQPTRTGAAFYEYAGSRFRCLPELLGKAGYSTVVMHANDPEFWGRATTYPAIGFQTFLHVDHFSGPRLGMGTSDVDFFEQAVGKVAAQAEPFYAVLLSLSSHVPFQPVQPFQEGGLRHGRFARTTVGWYLDAVHYADAALGRFLDGLRRTGLLERTVVVVFGDHWGVSRSNSNVGEYLGIRHGDAPRFFLEERRIPMLVRIPGVTPGTVRRAGGQIDLAPTLAALLGVATPDAAFLGRDLFDEGPRVVAFASGAAVDDERLYLSGDAGAGVEGCYRLDGLARVGMGECRAMKAEAERELRVGWGLFDGDLITQAGDARAEQRYAPTTSPSTSGVSATSQRTCSRCHAAASLGANQ